ncbi:ABC transporter permease [Frigoribacterium sp. VKM Ac-1396]|uniref:ABC transporter permease n=1 Tax=Frigoribacterium sp. VKM Ac-1396 TaxID=2783821 RepID=UPI00188D16B4|nr:ABC transporter permease [Frigoribacterium sp. VKM Ac-1396]MBF4599230.1 ABC transporter permease [Frigoribacterium sp. VKM Ac-1396]
MTTSDLLLTAVANTFRSKTRTILTILAIFVGAFTLTLTSGLGTGINAYIDDTVSAVGSSDTMTVTKASDDAPGLGAADSGPAEYDPDTVAAGGFGAPGATVVALTPDDVTTLEGVEGVLAVQPTQSLSTDYVEGTSGTKYAVPASALVPGQQLTLTAGTQPDDGTDLQVVIPTSYVDALGFRDDAAAVGQSVTLAVTDATRTQHTVTATVVGVAEESIASPAGASVTPNAALGTALFDAQNVGVPADQVDRYAQATVRFAADATDDQVAELKDRLATAGYTGTTVADQLGTFTTVIDGIVLVLNAFAIIALLAASFGIVNTLLMSVQERTREIGLMKAMGMGSGRVFALFSLEAAFIGFLGSAIGAGVAMIAGSVVSSALAGSLLSNLPGLTLIAFDPVSITLIIVVVMVIAFVAGTLPAARAAKADPVESLRYE